jgi:hypothetical protein
VPRRHGGSSTICVAAADLIGAPDVDAPARGAPDTTINTPCKARAAAPVAPAPPPRVAHW